MENELPSMTFNKGGIEHIPIKTIKVNNSIVLAVYAGALSEFDILIKYRQKLPDGKWTAIRTPKHIHWTVDILMKIQTYPKLTGEFLDFMIGIWNNTLGLKSEKERQSLDLELILDYSKKEIEHFKDLSKKGEYSVKFLILLAKLLMLQEKTNREDAYMFKRVLDGLKRGNDLFKILSTATLNAKR